MKLRVQFSKLGKVRFTSHRDVARIWERALRRAQLPVAYSEGFSPRPKLSFGLALPTGHESLTEYLDIDLDSERAESVDVAALPGLLSAELPVGITATEVVAVDARTLSLQQAVTSCTWQIDVRDIDAQTAQSAVHAALAAESIVVTRERKGKMVTDDIRPLVFSAAVDTPNEQVGPDQGCVRLLAELGTQPRAVRVSELLAALEPAPTEHKVLRLHQWVTSDDGQRTDPMSLGAPSPAPARVS